MLKLHSGFSVQKKAQATKSYSFFSLCCKGGAMCLGEGIQIAELCKLSSNTVLYLHGKAPSGCVLHMLAGT